MVYHILDMIKNIIFDWKRTLYDPDLKILINGTEELLKYLKEQNISLVLIGKGGDDMNEEVTRLGVKDYFQKIVFAQGDKDPKIYAQEITKDDPKETVFVGDRVRSEFQIGNKLGATTIWIKQGKFTNELPENNDQKSAYEVVSLNGCLKLLKTLAI